MKIFIAMLVVISGLFIFFLKSFSGLWFSAFSGLVSSLVVLGIIIFWEDEDLRVVIVTVLGGISMMLGVLSVFEDNEAFDPQLNKAHNDALRHLVEAQYECVNEIDEIRISEIIKYATLACALQNNKNMQGAISNLKKQLHLTPEIGLIDSIVSTAKENEVSECKSSFREVYKYCEESFIFMDEKSKNRLLN